jgi:AcrR family transcriptional regulator
MDDALPTRLRRSQDARRARVLEAVLDLCRGGGYDAVRLRTVWEQTGVGTDTIYRYFGSRERMISAAIAVWLEREFFARAPSWCVGDTPAEQLLALCRGSWTVWEREPAMLEPFVRAALTGAADEDNLAAASMRAFEPLMLSALDALDPDYRDDVLLVVNSVTHSAMTSVIRGQLAVQDAFPIVERTIRRLAQHPAMDGHRPAAWDYVPAERALTSAPS